MTVAPKEFYLPFIKKEKLANDTYSFYFYSANIDLNFLPGQYIRMTLSIENPDKRGNSRPFTIASSPLEKNHIMITTKIIQSSFKKRMMELKPKELVHFFGPIGAFILNEEEKEDRVFLAGGIGITPFHSMITYAEKKKLSIPITLLVSFSTVEDMIFYKELLNIAKTNTYIKIIYTITHPEEKTEWKGEVGRISDVLIKKYVENIFQPQYFIVGPPAMVAGMEEVVMGMGISNKRIFIENFTGY
ncbi:FAD-dependent oxidoreductase [Candidatus Roizmanbacteria bacterium]|nr:FAD-dependent oxidoreductase [Candidatus Roizmanbacteria bacterium]